MITSRSIHPHVIEAAKTLLDPVFKALWGISCTDIQARYDPQEDIEHIHSYYFENGGTFMVLAGGEKLICTGSISRLDADTAELKRIFLLTENRDRRFGETRLEFARKIGYRRVRLMDATPDLQLEAVGLNTRLGFHPLPTNPNSSKEPHMVLEFA